MRTTFGLFIFLMLIFPLTLSAESFGIDNPTSGWRFNKCIRSQFLQAVHYPASDVNVSEDQCDENLISGKLPQKDHQEKLVQLIVNGSAMPLKVDSARFSRPFTFAAGSNSVEIKTKNGTVLRRQFYEANDKSIKTDIRIILSWDTDGTDLDLHVVTPDGGHCYYGNRVLHNGGALDVDVTTGYGPEIFSMANGLPGQYAIYLNFYGTGHESDLTVATIDIILRESTIDEKRMTRKVPLRRVGEEIHVLNFLYD